MKYIVNVCFLVLILFSINVQASAIDYKKYYEVDLDAPVPDLKSLSEELEKETEIYNSRYMVSWDMGPTFDKIFKGVITSYGTSEKRIKSVMEDEFFDMIMMTPKEFYPYIGPYLHTLPGIPDRILMLPGIKETKNKFPERIAPQLQGIENLEFLSPHLYVLLMPEMWPDNQPPIEMPKQKRAKIPPISFSPDFMERVMKNTPEFGFGGAVETNNKPGFDKLRTLKITKDSPLTTGDIRAFLKTVSGVKNFGNLSNAVKIMHASDLLDYWERKNGTALSLNGLKDGVNPCQRLALKIKWAGLEDEFTQVVGKEGFSLNEWAYTCDKTIKAYRVSRVSSAQMSVIKAVQEKTYDTYVNKLKPLYAERQFATMQSIVEMHKAPKHDVFEAMKNEKLIYDALYPLGGMMIIAPISN
ncbi:MAG: hypothetical protein IJ019_06175 [Alphaproteobacteria bacterium]|nr:hypothetical protein [Alphaproteobacteria bacterium]